VKVIQVWSIDFQTMVNNAKWNHMSFLTPWQWFIDLDFFKICQNIPSIILHSVYIYIIFNSKENMLLLPIFHMLTLEWCQARIKHYVLLVPSQKLKHCFISSYASELFHLYHSASKNAIFYFHTMYISLSIYIKNL
jgi:hypothetical protein